MELNEHDKMERNTSFYLIGSRIAMQIATLGPSDMRVGYIKRLLLN
jgi:hypothetical protein